jgi:hypothetical protein
MYLEDPAAMTTLLLNMADRNIVSDEFVQRHIKATPDIENRRVISENKSKDEKVSPYHSVDKNHSLKKIALQTGVSSPSEVGLELNERKNGEKSLVDIRDSRRKQNSPRIEEPSAPGEQGRPKNSGDTTTRKPKGFQPKLKASSELWVKKAQEKISELINPIVLASYSKSSLRI